jgi:glycerol uptake facilitator-like aquaporin
LPKAHASFANPAVTLARAASDTFAGIRPADAPGFMVAQFAGGMAATLLFSWLTPRISNDIIAVWDLRGKSKRQSKRDCST